MAEYIDRKQLLENLNRFAPEKYDALINQLITDMPIADVVEVVRCKDCIYGHRCFNVHRGVTDSWVNCRNPKGINRDVSNDGYCSYGERKDV